MIDRSDAYSLGRQLVLFGVAGAPSFGMALVLNGLLLEYSDLDPGLIYALVISMQVVLNYFFLRRYAFMRQKNRGQINDFVIFLVIVSVARVGELVAYVQLFHAGLHFVIAQVFAISLFFAAKFSAVKFFSQ